MRRILTAVLAAFGWLAAAAQPALPVDSGTPADTARYAFPVRGVAGLYAANFGEIRPAHFHAGIDVKTDGVEGKELVAVGDGYVSRIVVTPSGYGRALYLTLSDGSTAVYGHLLRFRDDLEACMQAERYRLSSNDVDLAFPAGRFPVSRGERIGFSGNTGSSAGPHLHFELREAGTDRRLNTVRTGLFRPKDDIPPLMLRLHYFQVDTVAGVCLRSAPVSCDLVREANGRYRLRRTEPLPVGRKGYFVMEVSDRRNGVNNTFGIWSLRGSVDGEPFFEYRMDGFDADQSRCSDAVSWYPRQLRARAEVLQMARLTGAPAAFYPVLREQGLIRTEPGETRNVRIEVEDDCGNCSVLTFAVCGTAAAFRAAADSTAQALRVGRSNSVGLGRVLSARIPAGALAEDTFCRPEQMDMPQPADTRIAVLSPAVRIFGTDIPLFREITVSLQAEVPPALKSRATLASYNPATRRLSYVGGVCTGDAVQARTRTTGWLVAVVDTVRPTIRPQFADGADCSRAETLRFTASDNFSGIASATLSIDGRWVPCDRLPMRGLFYYRFETPPERRTHTVTFAVTDALGNTARWEGSFYR